MSRESEVAVYRLLLISWRKYDDEKFKTHTIISVSEVSIVFVID